MNIFATNICPIISAINLDDKRLVKMILESAQLLSSAIYLNDNIIYKDIYKPTHLKHPCTIWASLNSKNWQWLFVHFHVLCQEYSFRFYKKHATERLLITLSHYEKCLTVSEQITPFSNCTKSKILQVDFTKITNVHEAYKQYLAVKWNNDKTKPKWTNREHPNWFVS
jgi:hypothetical protein